LKVFDSGLGVRTRLGTFLGYTTNDPATRREITAGSSTLVDASVGYSTRLPPNHGAGTPRLQNQKSRSVEPGRPRPGSF
jgi:hypothetical protein